LHWYDFQICWHISILRWQHEAAISRHFRRQKDYRLLRRQPLITPLRWLADNGFSSAVIVFRLSLAEYAASFISSADIYLRRYFRFSRHIIVFTIFS
jgi:hypothetical protein